MWDGGATLENILAVLQKVVHRVTIWPSNCIPGYISKRTENTSIQMFIAARVTITKSENSLMSTNWEQVNKMWSIHTMEYYSAIKKNEVLIDAWVYTLMNLENMLSEISQTQKATFCMIPFIWLSRIGKSREIESRLQLVRGCGNVCWGVTANE